MYTLKTVTLIIFTIILSLAGQAQLYTNFDDFKDACSSASPGDEIILASGRYEAKSITLSNVVGTADNPVIIRAEEIGQDTLDDGTYFDLRHCSYVTIQGFVINITEKSTTFKIQTCNNITIAHNTLNGEGEEFYKEDGVSRNSSVWISIQSLWDDAEGLSHHNTMDHNMFVNKHTLGNMIKIDGTNDLYVSQYDVITNNYFKNMGPRATNEMEAIRIGWSQMSASDGYCRVENNLFEECNGDPEIISVKCNKNTIAHNTFLRCQGTLSLRHGNESLIEGNFFLGEGAEGTGGIRIYGSDHKIINNYFEGLTGTKWDAPITITHGDADEGNGDLTKHFRIERAIIANNTLKNNHHGIEVGFDNNGNYSKPARDVIMAYNVIDGDTNALVWYRNAPISMQWLDNITYTNGTATLSEGVTLDETQVKDENPLLVFNESLNYFKSSDQTPSITINTNLIGEILSDIDGQLRSVETQLGADELSNLPIIYTPLKASDVGPSMDAYLNASPASINAALNGGEFKINIASNVDWTISEESDWLLLDITSGSAYGVITVQIDENTSGAARTTNIQIQSADENNLQQLVVVNQSNTVTPILEISVSEFLFNAESETKSFTITSNLDWEIKNIEEWFTVSPETGNGDSSVEITVNANTSIATRNASIIVYHSDEISETISIEQSGIIGSEVKLNVIEAIASTEQTAEGNIAANVIDNDLSNRWSGQGDGAFIVLTLDTTCRISYLNVGLYKGNERTTMFDILASENGTDYYELAMGITSDITEELLVAFDFEDSIARYVKIIGHGNSSSDWNSFTEFEVWGWNLYSTDIANNATLQASVYPNPSNGFINISNAKNATLNIYNSQGKVVLNRYIYSTQDFIETELKNGLYIYTIEKQGIIESGKLIVN